MDPANVVLVDLRTSEEFEIHAIAGAINIPLVDLRERATELAKDKTIVVYCQVGKRGYFATKMLKQLGFADVVNLSGGYKLYHVIKSDKESCGIFDGDSFTSAGEIQTLNKTSETQETSVTPVVAADKQNVIEQGTDCIVEIDACGLSCPGGDIV